MHKIRRLSWLAAALLALGVPQGALAQSSLEEGFKNPPNESAGAIIDGLGLKGVGIGPVSVSEVHANFMVATKDATASDIFLFVERIRTVVRERAGIDLEPEIRFLGDFTKPGVTS